MSDGGEHCEGRLANVSAALLVGGASSRMGTDKAALDVGGQPMATRLSSLLGSLFEDVLLVGGSPPAAAIGRAVPDVGQPGEPRSALRGIVSALAAARTERVVVVATDLPLLSETLLLALACWPEHDAVVPRDAHGIHPLCAIYRRQPVLEVAQALLEAGKFKLTGVLEAVDTDYLEGPDLDCVDPDGQALTNVNTPDDAAASSMRLRGSKQAQ